MINKTKFILIIGFIIVLCVGITIYLIKQPPLSIDSDVAIVFEEAKEIADFNLVDFNNNQFTNQHMSGKWWLIYFGFTHCPDACPMALHIMKLVSEQRDNRLADKLNFALISVDPKRDTPERLKSYVQFFSAKFYAATGRVNELNKLTKDLGVAYMVGEVQNDNEYTVDHSTFMVLIDAKTRFKAIFKTPHNAESISTALKLIQAND